MWEKYSKTIEASREYHERYHRAVAHPLRRKILKLLSKNLEAAEIAENLSISMQELEYHLNVLESGFCIKRSDGKIVLTKEGEIVEHLED